MNLNEKPTREKYKEFYGSNIEQMELLIKDKRIPMTVKQIIERRLNSKQDDWKNNYFDTCDAVVYGENGKFKIVKDCKILRKMNKETELENGAIKITKQEYDKYKGKEFNKNSKKEEIWQYLIGDLYKKYIKMLDYVPNYFIGSKCYSIRAFLVYGLGGESVVFDGGNLDIAYARLVGVASEMRESSDKEFNLEQNILRKFKEKFGERNFTLDIERAIHLTLKEQESIVLTGENKNGK